MSWNKSPLAFEDAQIVFERALNSLKGIRITCKTRGAAIALRSRYNYWRKLNRLENSHTYPPDHPLHKHSIYDKLILRIGPKDTLSETVLYIEHHSIDNLEIEEIP
jgi:hypothetical protein